MPFRFHQALNLSVSPQTLIDPLWNVSFDGVSVVPRPGHAFEVDFPIYISGEIDGTVYVQKGNQNYGVGKAIIELVDTNGQVIKTQKWKELIHFKEAFYSFWVS